MARLSLQCADKQRKRRKRRNLWQKAPHKLEGLRCVAILLTYFKSIFLYHNANCKSNCERIFKTLFFVSAMKVIVVFFKLNNIYQG